MSTISSHGYVLVYVGKKHHLADVRGYAYEHRIVAETKLGRRLRKGELVHHHDQNKQNNHPDNLRVKKSNADHFFEHRKIDVGKKHPNAPNPLIKCRCGCGQQFRKFDLSNRPRNYISGHNPIASPTRNHIILCLKSGLTSVAEFTATNFTTAQAIKVAVSKMNKDGIIKRISHGKYSL